MVSSLHLNVIHQFSFYLNSDLQNSEGVSEIMLSFIFAQVQFLQNPAVTLSLHADPDFLWENMGLHAG